MKLKNLFASALAFGVLLPAAAQSESNPLPIDTSGENYYDAGYTYSSVYYTYTSEKGEYVWLDGIRTFGVTYTEDGQIVELPKASWTVNGVSHTAFYAEAGKKLIIEGYTQGNTFIQFTFSSDITPFNNGQDQANPITITPRTYIPCAKDGSGWSAPAVPVYGRYTASESGKLAISFPMKPNETFYSIGGGEELTADPQYNSSEMCYRCSIKVEAGQVVDFKFLGSSPVVGFFNIEQVVPGASMEDAFECKEGANAIPAAAGNYWYTFSTPAYPSESIAKAVSDAAATLDLCGSTGSAIQVFNAIHMRYLLPSSSVRYLIVHKAEATEAEESFDFSIETPQAYDILTAAPEIESGATVATPAFGGNYYYSLQTPENGAYFLDADFADGKGNDCMFYVYDNPNSYYSKYGNSIHFEAVNGTKYYVKVAVPYSQDGTEFKVALNAVKPGETAANPIVAVTGANEMAESRNLYYSFSPSKECWVNVAVEGASLPAVMCNGAMVTTLPVSENALRFEAVPGDEYVFNFQNVPAGASFTITENDYAEGESSATALQAVLGSNALPSAAGKTWLKYTAAETEFLILSTTLPYSYNTYIDLYVNKIDAANRYTMDYKYDYFAGNSWMDLKVAVAEGDECYILVTTSATRSEDAAIILSTEEIGPGQSIAKAIPMNLTFDSTNTATYLLPEISSDTWYSFELPESGLLSVSASDYISAVVYDHYGQQQIGTLSWSGFTDQSVTAGTFYVKVSSNSYADNKLTVSFRIPGPGEGMATAYEIPVTGNPTSYVFPKKPTDMSSVWYCLDLSEGTLTMDCFAWMIAGSVYDAAGNYMSSISEVKSFGTDHYGFIDINIPEAGRYYLKFTQLTPDLFGDNTEYATAEFSGSALENRSVGVAETGLGEGEAEYFTLSGVKVAGKPAPGIYIVRKGTRTYKTVVK